MFKRVFDVTFALLPILEVEDGDDLDGPDDEVELSTLVVCTEDLSLQNFTNQLVENKDSILERLGYPSAEYEATLVKVEDVTDANTVVMMPQATTH